MFWCRYKITGDVGDGHKVLGKLMNYSMLSTRELDKLVSDVAMMDTSKCAVYGRVLLSGVLYTSAMYHRSEVTNDSINSLLKNRRNRYYREVCKFLREGLFSVR